MEKKSDKQAVLLIHGIGEQKPMETLRGFIDAVWCRDDKVHHKYAEPKGGYWSKPYNLSKNYELRRLTTTQNNKGIRTDFFEFYWAHLVHGTTLTHVLGWIRFIVLRSPKTLPPNLYSLYFLLCFALLLFALFAVNAALPEGGKLFAIPAWLSLLVSIGIIPALGSFLKYFVGDAARYLYPAPVNIQCRHAIRSAGVEILKKLHARGYRRIVVVGHSLGSVIGYDILTHAWVDGDFRAVIPPDRNKKALRQLEKMALSLKAGTAIDIDAIQTAQRDYFEELQVKGYQWRVTDFITLGSPLAHAEVLLARDRRELKQKMKDRELPVCLPDLEKLKGVKDPLFGFSYGIKFDVGKKNRVTHWIPHHAAVFAAVKWTNIYFPVNNILWGDFIAGPLAPIFGWGIRDVPVTTPFRDGFFSHTLYWKNAGGTHIEALRHAIDLGDNQSALG